MGIRTPSANAYCAGRRPGITTSELASRLNLSVSTTKSRVRMLALGRHVRRNDQHGHRLYPTHNKTIGKVQPREKARIAKGQRGKEGRPND